MNKGFIKIGILIISVIIILSIFDVSLRSIFGKKSLIIDNLSFVWEGAEFVWDNYLQKPTLFIWNLFYNYLWITMIDLVDKIRD
jgi:hypothetical protein